MINIKKTYCIYCIILLGLAFVISGQKSLIKTVFATEECYDGGDPCITAIEPTSAKPGETLTIYGKNLGFGSHTAKIYFGNYFLDTESFESSRGLFGQERIEALTQWMAGYLVFWGSERIIVKVPWRAKTGNIRIYLRRGIQDPATGETEITEYDITGPVFTPIKIVCPDVYDPVCVDNEYGRTFANECELNSYNIRVNIDNPIYRKGACLIQEQIEDIGRFEPEPASLVEEIPAIELANRQKDSKYDDLIAEYNKLKQLVKKLNYKVSQLEQKLIKTEKSLTKKIDRQLTQRLKGRILLQVENNGEAWYVDEKTNKRFYLRDGNSAFTALQAFGLGITNDNLAKIPIEGSGQKGDPALIDRLRGKILLQVEDKGQAWYVNPTDGKRHYLRNGNEAFKIMKELSLGVNNDNLRKIDVGDFEVAE